MYALEISEFTQATDQICQQVAQLSQQIPELNNPLSQADIKQRLACHDCLILLAYVEGEMAGFKLGYAKTDGEFYSWLGGVLPDFRQLGLAKSMLEYQERWAQQQGYSLITVKTHNHFNAMLNMLVSSQYQITAIDTDKANVSLNKLHLQKSLNQSKA